MNLPFPSSRHCSCTTNALILSHLPSKLVIVPLLFVSSRVSIAAARARSNRCRAVMHSFEQANVEGTPRDSRILLIVKLLPVASRPWTRRTGGLANLGLLDVRI